MHRALALLALLLVVAPTVAAQAPGTPSATVDLALPPRVALSEAVLLVGNLTFEPATVERPGAVGAIAFDLPPGRLLVCNRDRSTGAVLPPLDPE
ncbi:MAG TPA: hypothetical protein VNZ52_12435, partial [Candidatus Thermoplasmatota archaeon]|nr:hypothetical protein [Candidatus Thermoplasmatota archaeon]